MIKRHLPHILTASLILTIVAFPVPAQAIWGIDDVVGAIVSPLVLLILKLTAFLAALGGLLLNSIVYYTVLQMAENFARLPAVDDAWKVIRDVANMGFIFVLLYAAIQKVIGIGKDTNRLIVNMIIAAILVNFSLFFTKAIIDVANLLALFFYELIAPGAASNPDFTQTGISNAFVEPMGIQTLWKASGDFSNFVVMGIMGGIVQMIAAFMFFAIAIMFVVRYVVLIFVLILSPIMVLSMVLPGLNGYAKKWWDALLGQAFFAPVYFLLAWITVFIINRMVSSMFDKADWSVMQTGIQTANGMDSLNYSQGLSQAFISFAVIIAFMIISLIVAKGVADGAGSGVASMTKWAMGAAGGATMGVAGRLGRGTIGRAGQALADSEAIKKAAPTSRLARLALVAGRKTAGSTFDARGSAGYEKLSGATGVSFGKAGGKGGFNQMMEDKVKKEEKFAESLKPSDLVVGDAERALDSAKKIDSGAAEFNTQRASERIGRGEAMNNARAKLATARSGGASAEEIEKLEKEFNEAEKKYRSTDDNNVYKKSLVDEAQARVDAIKGLSEDEARKRRIRDIRVRDRVGEKQAKKTLAEEENMRFQRIQELVDSGMSEKDAKKQAKDEGAGWAPDEIKSASSQRQEAYAKKIEEAKIFGLGNEYMGLDSNRIAFIGPVAKEARMSAAKIRKKIKEKKPADKLAEELSKARESGADDAAATAPTPGPTPTPTPPPGPTTP